MDIKVFGLSFSGSIWVYLYGETCPKCDPMLSPLIYIFTLRYCLSPSSPSPVRSIKLNPTVASSSSATMKAGSARLLLGVRTPAHCHHPSSFLWRFGRSWCHLQAFLPWNSFSEDYCTFSLVKPGLAYTLVQSSRRRTSYPGLEVKAMSQKQFSSHSQRFGNMQNVNMDVDTLVWSCLHGMVARWRRRWGANIFDLLNYIIILNFFFSPQTSLKWTVKIWNTIPQK